MGYMTTVTILNDCWHLIKENPNEFVEKIELGMNSLSAFGEKTYLSSKYVTEESIGSCSNPIKVSRSFHADDSQIFYVGENLMTNLTDYNPKTEREIKIQLERINIAKKRLIDSENHLKELLKKEES